MQPLKKNQNIEADETNELLARELNSFPTPNKYRGIRFAFSSVGHRKKKSPQTHCCCVYGGDIAVPAMVCSSRRLWDEQVASCVRWP
jgi:hypothetical protein